MLLLHYKTKVHGGIMASDSQLKRQLKEPIDIIAEVYHRSARTTAKEQKKKQCFGRHHSKRAAHKRSIPVPLELKLFKRT